LTNHLEVFSLVFSHITGLNHNTSDLRDTTLVFQEQSAIRSSSPEGSYDNSPAFSRLGTNVRKISQSRGTVDDQSKVSLCGLALERHKFGADSAVPSGLIHRQFAGPNLERLGYSQSSLRDDPNPSVVSHKRLELF